jgi:hypothetical protein
LSAVAAKPRPHATVRPAGRPPHVPGLPDPGQWYRLDDVEIFAVGDHREGEPPWTPADLRAIVKNFELHQSTDRGRVYSTLVVGPPTAELGHFGDGDKWMDDTAIPAAGVVESLRFDEGDGILRGDIGRVPAPVADAIRRGAYFTVSAVIYPKPPPGAPGEGPMLKRVAFLGGELPQVKILRPPGLPKPYADAGTPVRHTPPRAPAGGAVRVYSEGRAMAEAATADERARLIGILQAVGQYRPSMDDEATYPTAALWDQVEAAIGVGQETPAEDASAQAEAAPAADPAPGLSPDQMRQEMVAAGYVTEDEAKALADDQVAEKYRAWKGTGMSEKSKPAPRPAATFAEMARQAQEQLAKTFAEKQAELDRREKQLESKFTAREQAERAKAREATLDGCHAFAERMVKNRLMKPAGNTAGTPESGLVALETLLASIPDEAPPAATYSEGGREVKVSLREAFMKWLEANLAPIAAYGERIGGTAAGRAADPMADLEERSKKFAADMNRRLQGAHRNN